MPARPVRQACSGDAQLLRRYQLTCEDRMQWFCRRSHRRIFANRSALRQVRGGAPRSPSASGVGIRYGDGCRYGPGIPDDLKPRIQSAKAREDKRREGPRPLPKSKLIGSQGTSGRVSGSRPAGGGPPSFALPRVVPGKVKQFIFSGQHVYCGRSSLAVGQNSQARRFDPRLSHGFASLLFSGFYGAVLSHNAMIPRVFVSGRTATMVALTWDTTSSPEITQVGIERGLYSGMGFVEEVLPGPASHS